MRTMISPPSWEFERHRRGSIRWYPFDTLMFNGLSSAGSTRSLASPIVSLYSGASTATPQSRGCESVERKQGAATSDIWTGLDGGNYWSRAHHITCFCGAGTSSITPIGGRFYYGIFLELWNLTNGLPPLPATPIRPVVLLRYARNGLLEASPDERFELVTAVGDGVTASLVTRLTGVPGPISDLSASARTQRFEIFYEPGQYVEAYIDGILGARVTSPIPDPTNVPVSTQNLAGIGTWLEASNSGNEARADFHSFMLEGYRD